MSAHNANARLETFCDGVIAIAITLLILEIKIPPLESVHSAADLKHILLEHWPSWFAYVLSFGSILVAWSNHHSFFKYLSKSSTLFVYANGFLLITIAALPYPTGLMAEYIKTDYAQPAIQFYCFVSLIHNIFQAALKPKNLAKNETAYNKLIEGRRTTIYGGILYAAICALSFWYPYVSLVLITLSWAAWVVIGIVFSDAQTEQA